MGKGPDLEAELLVELHRRNQTAVCFKEDSSGPEGLHLLQRGLDEFSSDTHAAVEPRYTHFAEFIAVLWMVEKPTGAHNVSAALGPGKPNGTSWLEKVFFWIGEQVGVDRLDRKIVFDPLEVSGGYRVGSPSGQKSASSISLTSHGQVAGKVARGRQVSSLAHCRASG